MPVAYRPDGRNSLFGAGHMGGANGDNPASNRLGDAKAIARLVGRTAMICVNSPEETVARKRRMVADLCRLLGSQIDGQAPAPPAPAVSQQFPASQDGRSLPPRVEQTLTRLLVGDSEKQIAVQLGLSRHTVYCYVKSLYRRYEVSSRGELLARFIDSGTRA
jgi:DNA-binding CsgD family transcriptional regulator